MKNWKILLFGLLVISWFCVSSCDKYNSKITGKVFYTDIDDGINYPAARAVVTKMVQKNDSLYFMSAVFADANGEFLFDHTTKGTWILSGKFENDTIFYFGVSESFDTDGKKPYAEQIIIILKPLINNDLE